MSDPGPTPHISFIIPVFNGLSFTKMCLDSLRRTVDLSRCEVIVADDQSTDGTREYLAALPKPPFRILANDHRRGYAASNNAAAAVARGELLCLLNNDVVLSAGWLEPMVCGLDRFSDAGFIGNVQRNPRTGRYDHMGFVFDDDGVPWLFGKHFPFRPYGGYTEWRAVSAACCLIKKQLFLTMGGFDEQYINGSEDLDLCLRIGQAGRRHYVANESIVTHYVSSSQDRHAFNAANEQRLLARWQAEIQQSLTPRDRILNAANYVLRFATRPWRYNGQRLWRATLSLVSLGRFSHGTARAGY